MTAANHVPPGYCTGPSNVQFNLRIAKVIGFGKRNNGPAAQQDGGPGGPGGGPPGGGFGGGINSRNKYTINIGAQIQTLFNYVPYATPNGALTSYSSDPSKNLFGKSTSLSSFRPGSSSAVRTITLQMNFSF